MHDEIVYMLKYVADKLNSRDRKNCQCFHYELNDGARKELGLALADSWYTTSPHNFRNASEKFRFQILGVQLYCFSTTVCIMAFKLHFEKDDPLWISAAQYYLKKVSREKIYPDGQPDEAATMLQLAENIMETFRKISDFSFFYYANPSTERANVLTYLEVGPKEDYKYELFYLRRCYSEGFLFAENEKQDSEEIYSPSQDTIWGISPEAAVCLVCPDRGRRSFLQGTFFRNFNAQYLFMYVLLLHQKYVLYMFLTKIGVGTYNNLEMLEEYRHQLYEFETDFVFSCVTEVPQYQNLYDRMVQAFSLKKMYEDVHEPLLSLGEVRRVTSENEQKKRDDNVNKALFMLSVLSFFSALIDSFDFAESFFGWFLTETGVKIVQVICVLLIVGTAVFVFRSLWKTKKE
ncbi:MAG: hypothetical protein Q4C58_08320 [Eubacteriales bacterium]|nr:hypothetical protein [Eubacteriales bacterium]